MSLTIARVGHVVLRATDLAVSCAFYEHVLGLRTVGAAEFDGARWVFLSSGNSHHDLALVEAADASAPQPQTQTHLHHVAFEIGSSVAVLARARTELERAGVTIHATLDFTVSQALFLSDPDGVLIELYVNAPDEPWRENPSLVATARPLELR